MHETALSKMDFFFLESSIFNHPQEVKFWPASCNFPPKKIKILPQLFWGRDPGFIQNPLDHFFNSTFSKRVIDVNSMFIYKCSYSCLFFLYLSNHWLESMAHSKNRATDGKITYPPGVKEISDKISKEEMVRRLKVMNNLSFIKVERVYD